MSVKISTLDNGFRVITDEVNSVESIGVGIWTGTGSRYEKEEENGIAHFLEHMIFKGTEKRTAVQIAEDIENVGGHFNAYTSREQTAYYVRLLSEYQDLGLDILADVLKNSTFDPNELERERDVILQEIGRCYDTPDDVLFDHFFSATYPNQSVGWPILGTPETVGSISQAQLRNFISNHYQPHRMVLSAAGKLKHEEIVAKAQELFGDMKSDGRVFDKTPAKYDSGWFVDSRELEQIHIVYGFKGFTYDDPLYYAAHIFSSILGGGMSSKLFQEVREKRGLVYAIQSFNSHLSDGGTFAIYAGTGKERITELNDTVKEILLETPGNITAEEFNRSKIQLKSSLLMARESITVRFETHANQLLKHNRHIGPDEIKEKIENVTMEDLGKVAEHIKSAQPSICLVGPWDKENRIDFQF